MEPIEYYQKLIRSYEFLVVLCITHKVIQNFEPMDETLQRDHSNESY